MRITVNGKTWISVNYINPCSTGVKRVCFSARCRYKRSKLFFDWGVGGCKLDSVVPSVEVQRKRSLSALIAP